MTCLSRFTPFTHLTSLAVCLKIYIYLAQFPSHGLEINQCSSLSPPISTRRYYLTLLYSNQQGVDSVIFIFYQETPSRITRFAHDLMNRVLCRGTILALFHLLSSRPNITVSFSSSIRSGRFAPIT